MRPTSDRAWGMLVMLTLAGCPGGSAALGDVCSDTSDCASELQCLSGVCVPRCQRGPDCGEGFACDKNGICQSATGAAGETCTSETDCAAGLACEIDGTAKDANGILLASCTAQNATMPADAPCTFDGDCRDGTCALGRCVDLCSTATDCSHTSTCMAIPRVDQTSKTAIGAFNGCLPASGSIRWTIPIAGPSDQVLLPVPSGATSISVLFSVDDPTQLVGATRMVAPDGTLDFKLCTPQTPCDETTVFYANPVRHSPGLGEAVLAMPSSPSAPLQPGMYTVNVSSLRADLAPGSAIPKMTVVAKLDEGVILDFHFHFLDLSDHPCAAQIGPAPLSSTTAPTASFFKDDFLGTMKGIFAHGGVSLGDSTYDDILDHPDLDGLDIADAPSLLALGAYAGGVNVFFVRTLSPVGLEAFGPNPGPAAIAGTAESGIVIGTDTLCYRTWTDVARITAHEVARYMGLYHNVEADSTLTNPQLDPIPDSDDTNNNLMYYSEFGGVDLSVGQRDILSRSAVLR